MSNELFDSSILGSTEERLDFLTNVLQSSVEYSIICKGLDGTILLWNEGARRLYGYEPEEVVGLANSSILHTPEDIAAGKPAQMLDAALQDGKWEGALTSVRKNGEQFTARMVLTPHRNGKGRATGFLLISKDISEEIRRDHHSNLHSLAQERSELRYRRLFESAKDGILILDADTGQIIDANPYLMATLGYSYDELIGKELWEIGFFKDIAAAKKAFVELRDKGYVRYDDLPLETRGGLVIEVEIVSNSYLVGESNAIQCNIRDITQRSLGKRALEETNRKLEATLGELSATTQQLWQASKLTTMGELSASIAHELNNPLATVALRVENLLMPLAEDDPKRRSLHVISQEVDRMASLVNNLLQFSRRSHRQISTVDVCEEIANSIEFVRYHLGSHKIGVVREFADPLPTIQADRQQLRQLFLNLLTNASDAMPEGGTLTVLARSGVLHKSEAVQIQFVDTGEGIATENLKKIWDPFFTTKAERKGTGLGLAICRRIVEEHGGAIEIESERGWGTTVRMLFPATASLAAANLE